MKVIALGFVLAMSVGCSVIPIEQETFDLGTPTEAISWIYSHITYVHDEPGKDNWQLPSETIARGKGDCDDVAILLMSALRSRGYSSRMVLVSTSLAADDLKDPGQFGHALVEFEEKWISPQWKMYQYMPALFTPAKEYYTFERALEQAQTLHNFD
jgi:hypothetical protein